VLVAELRFAGSGVQSKQEIIAGALAHQHAIRHAKFQRRDQDDTPVDGA
jgi:hypothetical protein